MIAVATIKGAMASKMILLFKRTEETFFIIFMLPTSHDTRAFSHSEKTAKKAGNHPLFVFPV
jgi:hypothetical protein